MNELQCTNNRQYTIPVLTTLNVVLHQLFIFTSNYHTSVILLTIITHVLQGILLIFGLILFQTNK